MRILAFISTFISFLLMEIPLYGQEYIFDAQLIDRQDGLANLFTNAVFKDKKSWLWVGTKYGLNRYDGHNFELYTKEGNGLYRNDGIVRITEDEKGNLWIFNGLASPILPRELTMEAIDVFNPVTRKATPLDTYFGNSLPFKASEVIGTNVIDPLNRLWITTNKGAVFLNDGDVFKKVFEKPGVFFQYLTVDQQGHLWLAWQNNLIRIDMAGKVLETIDVNKQISGVWVDDANEVLLTTIKIDSLKQKRSISIWSKDKNSNTIIPFLLRREGRILEGKDLTFAYRSTRGFWYTNIEKQLNLFNEDGEWLFNYQHILGEELRVELLNVLDDDNHFWAASSIGLIKTRVRTNPFQLIYRKDVYSDCRGITEDESGNIYFSQKYIYQWNPIAQTVQKVVDKSGALGLLYLDSLLWSSCYSSRVTGFEYDLKNQQVSYYPAVGGFGVYSFLKTENPHQFLIGRTKGIAILDLQQKNVFPYEQYKEQSTDFQLLQNSFVSHLYENEAGIWCAAENGIFLLEKGKNTVRRFSRVNGTLPFDYIRHIYEDADGVFWLATKGGGVIQWQPPVDGQPASIIKQFTIEDGLSNNFVYAIYADDYGTLWMSSDKGLMSMSKTNESDYQAKTYLTTDGLPHNEFNLTAHYQAKDGTLYFGGLGGLIAFDPKIFEKEEIYDVPLECTGYNLLEGGKGKMTDQTQLLYEQKKIQIKPTDKLFELHFALLDYEKPERYNYEYKIEGYTDSWIPTKGNNVRITNLPYGNYTLNIRGKKKNTGWSKKILSLPIQVLTPFYLQWWFLTAAMVCIGALLFFMVKRRESKFERDRELLEQVVQKRTRQIEFDKQTIADQASALRKLDKAKTRFFSNITHEFRTPLTLITGPVEQLLSENPAPTVQKRLFSILKNGRHLLQLINQLLDLSKLESEQMTIEVNRGDIVDYTRELTNRFKPLADQKQQELVFGTDRSSWETQFDQDKWNKIIYNLLSNAIKFTPTKGNISLTLKQVEKSEQEFIVLTVKDTGKGIPADAIEQIFDRFHQVESSSIRSVEGTGIGLALVKELVELQNGEISVDSEMEIGTTFKIVLPVLSSELAFVSIRPVEEQVVLAPLIVEQTPDVEQTDLPTQQRNEKLELLLIEDNKEMREYIRYCIDESKYNISEASNGVEGIKKALEIIPDLIVSDVMMPQKNGFEVVQTIRNEISTSHIPLILLTAKTALESRLEGFKRGADAYLTKPFSPQELVLRIQKLIEIRQLLQQRYAINSIETKEIVNEDFAKEDQFINDLRAFIIENIESSNLNGEFIGKHFSISRMQLYRKLKALTNRTITEFVRSIRLEFARQLVQEKQLSISEIAYQTGFSSPSHFSRTFKQKFGKSPSEF